MRRVVGGELLSGAWEQDAIEELRQLRGQADTDRDGARRRTGGKQEQAAEVNAALERQLRVVEDVAEVRHDERVHRQQDERA